MFKDAIQVIPFLTVYSLKIECRIGRIPIVQLAISKSIFCGDRIRLLIEK